MVARLARLHDEERAGVLSTRRQLAVSQIEYRLGLSARRPRREELLDAAAAADADVDSDFAELVSEIGYQAAAIERANETAWSAKSMARWKRVLDS